MRKLTRSLFTFAGLFVPSLLVAAPVPTAPAEGAVVPLVKAGQKAYLDLPREARRELFVKKAAREKLAKVGYCPEPVVLSWTGTKGDVEVKVCRASDGKVFFATNAADLSSASVVNLEIARAYTWTVKDASGSATAHFTTEDYAPRFIQIARIPNIRDLGGRIGLDGRRVKQGLVYRSAGLNDNAVRVYLNSKQLEAAVRQGGDALEKLLAETCDSSFKPTDVPVQAAKVRRHVKKDGKVPVRYQKRYLLKSHSAPGKERLTAATRAYMTKDLGIRTDIDLRSLAECYGMTCSPLGPDVTWAHYSSSAYGGMADASAKQTFAKVFRMFLDEKNYPIVFHCIAGADRTGAVGYILNALLGVADDDLYKDWETTGFNNRSTDFCHANRFDKLVAVFKKYPGDSTRARVEAYVKEQGFTDEEIAKFRSIMLEASSVAAPFALQQAEFAKYHRAITGCDPAPNAVTFAVDPKVSATGKDAYTIRSVELPAGNSKHAAPTCRITGSNIRSVWYGLYDLLERRGGCHWFWDVDVVPKKDAIDLGNLDVKEEAHFEYRAIRYFAHRGLTRFQAEHWGPEDWRREIDWCLKRRLNVFMLRIGQDDLFQRAFPETCAYPDAAKDLPGHGKGYDNRTLFWSLEFRGQLRKNLQRYAFDRGLMVPEDFGTMSHWYSRTPEDFLAKKKPPFLPQATHTYSEKNGLVWDIRDDKWADEYWKLTTTAVDAYGEGRNQQLLHTIGLGERKCFANRADNLALKIVALNKFLDRAHRDYPNAKTLIAGWDFYSTWRPDEVRELVAQLDPKRDIIWDYEGDSSGNNFTQWGLVGKFPYTYSVFLAYECALDIRANYPLIEARQKIVQNDPACVGYIFWPESSHTDTLLLRYFTANAWSVKAVPVETVLDEFCASRYGERAGQLKAIWQKVIPLSQMHDWRSNYSYLFTRALLGGDQYKNEMRTEQVRHFAPAVAAASEIFAALAEVDWTGEAIRRDTIDLARTTLDRVIVQRTRELTRDYELWRAGKRTGDDLVARINRIAELAETMADVLALQTDYSLWESYQRLDAVEKVRNPNFTKVLFENASCGYCQSHQYELARHWYAPRARAFARKVAELVGANDRTSALSLPSGEAARQELMARPLESLRPTLPRTAENYRRIMMKLASSFPCGVAQAGAWRAYEGNPVLGNRQLGTCFDVNVIANPARTTAPNNLQPAPADRDAPAYLMYFSWRPKKAIARVTSADGLHWTQTPEICLVADPASGWEDDLNRSTTVFKDGVWHMWYTGQAKDAKRGLMSRIGYATSKDGIHFTRVRREPVMVSEAEFEKASVMNPYVRWDAKRSIWRMWYAAGESYEPNVLCYAESADGLNWKKWHANPIFGAAEGCAWDRDRVGACEVHPLPDGRWVMFYIGYSDVDTARIGCAFSDDGITNWRRHAQNPIVAPDICTWNSSACYKPSVVRDEANKRWLLWYNGRNGTPEYIGCAIHDGLDLEAPAQELPDTKELLKTYVRRFNAKDVEHYTNAVPNAAAEDFMLANCPRFACPDKDIERTYYFRWWTFRKHLRHDLGVWTVSEFLPKVSWSGAGNTIVCPAGHHLREGRWLRDAKYASENARFWLADPRAKHRWSYSSWLFTGACDVAAVTGEDKLPVELLDAAVAYYRRWEQGFERSAWPKKGKVFMGGDGKGGFVSIDNYEGTECSLGGNGYKPLLASAMWSEAKSIAKVAKAAGRADLAAEFAAKAEANRQSILAHCWNADVGFFTTGGHPSSEANPGASGIRELHGYAPWYFGVPTDGRAPDWTQLSDPQGFAARYGLTFCERRAPGFAIDYQGHECKWNGPTWPFATSIALTALANDLHARHAQTQAAKQTDNLFASLLWQYADAQRRTHPAPWMEKGAGADWEVVPWIDENKHPDKDEWLSREIIRKTPEMAKRFPFERGKDYNHSTFCDLVISGLVGFIPEGTGFAIDPLFPATWDYLVLENLRYRGHDIDIRWQRGKGLHVFVDGKLASTHAFPTKTKRTIRLKEDLR